MKKLHFVLLLILCMSLVGGCGLIPEVKLSDEDSQLVAEYAAGLLLKYDGQHNNGLAEITDEPIATETPESTPDELPVDDETADDKSRDLSGLVAEQELSAAIGIPDFEVNYSDYQICDFYPEQDTDDLVFSMQAQQGYDLLVLHFDVTNPTDSSKECDVVSNAPLFRAVINDDLRLNAQTTFLLNDLSAYKDMIDAGASVDTVLVFEIEEKAASDLDQISLLIVGEPQDSIYQLK